MKICSELTRVNEILSDKEFNKFIKEIEGLEQYRMLCHHNMEHFLAVARIGSILNLQEGTGIDRELIYAAALLHDIGRGQEYLTGVRHEKESARLAPDILQRAGFNGEEISAIISAISNHRNEEYAKDHPQTLDYYIYHADKLSRACFYCEASEQCSKRIEKRNLQITL